MWTCRRFDSLPYPVRHQLALVLGEEAQDVELVGSQVNLLAGECDEALLEIHHQVADLDDRLTGRRHPPEAGAKPGQELVEPHRLRDVVVGAGVERGDLLVLVAHRREHDHGCRAPGAELAAHLGSSPVRQDQVEDHGIRRAHRRLGQRPLGGVCRLDDVSRGAEARAQGA